MTAILSLLAILWLLAQPAIWKTLFVLSGLTVLVLALANHA